ncbi:uncharacterized protein LOC134823674 [Bolinopsis microptera]|uniref:uncharacterized protein LOC134823674 n=1 Tax=Bolinopsis microptera TaxID=2820187 RepID=UPI00307AABD9
MQFKAALTNFVKSFPEEPPAPGYSRRNGNSLLDWSGMVIKQFLYCPGIDFFDGPIEDSMKPNKVTKSTVQSKVLLQIAVQMIRLLSTILPWLGFFLVREATCDDSDQEATLQLLLNSSPVTQLVSGFKLTLECDIAGGAKSINWFQNDEKLTVYEEVSKKKVESNDELIEKMTISLITNNDNNDPVYNQFKCQGMISDETNFNSNSILLQVFPAKTTKVPADKEHTYEDESHEFVCQFPNGDVPTTYTVSWEFNKQSMVDQTWYTIDTKVTKPTLADGNTVIETIFKITKVDAGANGEYSCSITWPDDGVVISSGEITLAVRLISDTTEAFSMSSGFPAMFMCSAVGDKVAAITFSITDAVTDMSRDVTVVVTESVDDQQRVTTVGNLDLSQLTASSFINCAVQWDGDATILTSNPNLVTVMSVDITDKGVGKKRSDGWVAEKVYLELKCIADVQLPHHLPYWVYPNPDFEWMLRTEKSSKWVKIVDSDDIEFTIKSSKTYGDRLMSALTLGPIQIEHNKYDVKCNVDYHSNVEQNFQGGKVSSEEFEVKVMHIKSFLVVSDDTIVVGEDFDLVCLAYGPPDSKQEIELLNNSEGKFYHFHTKVYDGDGENYREDFTVNAEYVVLDGANLTCQVGFEDYSFNVSKSLLVKSYYDCTKAPISSFDTLPPVLPGMSIEYTDDKGDRTAKVICPDDDVHGKYIIDGTDYVKEESFCSKRTGAYEPPQLASCKFVYPFVHGTYEQVWDLQKADFTVCEYEDTNEDYYYSSTQIWKNLVTRSDKCGTHIVVPCLQTNECTLVDVRGKTGCRWNDETKALTIFYTVKLTNKVWTEKERDALVNLPLTDYRGVPLAVETKIPFYDCSGAEWRSRIKFKYLGRMEFDADSNTVIERKKGKSLTGLYIGIVVAILLAIGAAIVVYYRKALIGRLRN